MGNTSGKSKKGDLLNQSFHDLSGHGHLSEREASSAWYRYGVSVTDVYDVVEVLGQGNMGEVFTVRRKTTGHHTDLTREKMKESEDDLKLMLKKEEEIKEKARKETKAKNDRKLSLDTLASPIRRKGSFSDIKSAIKKKVQIGKGQKGGDVVDDDANSNLAPFIKHDEEFESQCTPRESGTNNNTPLKPIIRNTEESKFSSGDLEGQDFSHQSSGFSNTSSSPPYVRKTSTSSEKLVKKGVHFQRTFAVKTILTSRINKDQLQELVNEIMIMRKLDHPYVLKLYEVYHIKRKLWLVTELLTGGDLSSRKLNEHDTKNVIEMVLRALVYLHRMGIVHRDIKLENVLYENHGKNSTVRLIDFGLSKTFDRASVAADYARTPYTMSPETFTAASSSKSNQSAEVEVMTEKTDVWAVGVMTFIMLSGEFPFIKTNADLNDAVKMERLKKADLQFGITWKGRGISPNAKEFVKGCLKKDPNERWTSKQALEHLQKSWAPPVDKIWNEWQAKIKASKKPEFVRAQDLEDDDEDEEASETGSQGSSSSLLVENDDEVPPSSFDAHARAKNIKKHVQKIVTAKKAEAPQLLQESVKINMDEIEKYTKFGFMKKTILLTMANTMDRGDTGKLRELFLKSDTDDTGTITLNELIAAFRQVSPEVDVKRVEELFIGIDRDQSGHIHYNEFLAALAESHGLVTLDRLTEAFDRIDTDGKGYITHDDLKTILGKDYDKEKVDSMIEEGDFKKNNKIDYEELLQLMFSDPVKGANLAGSVTPQVSFGDE